MLAESALLAGRIAEVCEGRTLPDLDLRTSGVRVQLVTSTPGQFSAEEAARAHAISVAARELGMTSDPGTLQVMRLAIQASDTSSVRAFWQSVLGYKQEGGSRLEDPSRRDPAISFSDRREQNRLRGRIHFDVVRPADPVKTVMTALGQESFGVFGLTISDVDGNEIDFIPGDRLSKAPETSDWSVVFGALAVYPTESSTEAIRLASAVAGMADDAKIPLLVDLRPDGVTIDSGKDQWDDAERSEGPGRPDPSRSPRSGAHCGHGASTFRPTSMDAVDVAAVREFWTSVLGYQKDTRASVTDIFDPRRLNPVIIFQDLDTADEDRRRERNRLHIELHVSPGMARMKTEAVMKAGGRALSGGSECWRTYADPEGNEVTIVTPAPVH